MKKSTPVFGDPQWNAVEQMEKLVAPTAEKTALMADHHLGYSMPIGGVAAYKDKISPSGVGFDIACGNKAVRLDADADDVRKNIGKIMDDVVKSISFGMGRNNNEKVDGQVLNKDEPGWDVVKNVSKALGKGAWGLLDLAYRQLGTVGGGNHYVDIFVDEEEYVWIGVHFGSRGLGHKIATHFIKEGGGKDGMNVPPVLLSIDDQIGKDYLKAMELAGKYAYAGRDWVCAKVAKIIGAKIVEEIHNHHNYAWFEWHPSVTGKDMVDPFWVVRKGATPAWPGQKGFVGGSMGDNAVIIEGVDHEESKQTMYSTVHGAGRVMGRAQAKGKQDRKTGEWKRQPLVTKEDMLKWVTERGVELRGADVDESPQAYKRLDEVLVYHSNTIKILHTLQPIGVAMAGPDIVDPFKD